MLSDRGRRAVHYIMKYGCMLKVYPYSWDPVAFRLKQPPLYHIIMYHLRCVVTYSTFLFMIVRLIQTVKDPEIISRLRVMHIIWNLAYFMVLVCNVQFEVRRGAILFFANSLFAEIDRRRDIVENAKIKSAKTETRDENLTAQEINMERPEKNADPEDDKQDNKTPYDWVSVCIVLGAFLLFINPPAHAVVLYDIPCAPQYFTSLYYNCKDASDNPLDYFGQTMWFILESFFVAHNMFALSFHWSMCFLGLTWIKLEVIQFNKEVLPNLESIGMESAIESYRHIQTLLQILNDAFQRYLECLPSTLFTIAAMLIFGTIKYTSVPFYGYLPFPLCGARCIFEAVTALTAAADVNEESKNCLIAWDHRVKTIEDKFQQLYFKNFRKSLSALKCMAGSFYSFENSIVLVSLSNCLQLTLNMFVMFPVENI